jgi:hypothetical protein
MTSGNSSIPLNMLLYNVTVGIDKDVEQEWLYWMKTEHIPEVMRTNLFTDYKIYKVLHDQDEGSISYSIQYFAQTLDQVTLYFERFAPSLLEKLRLRFKDKHVAFMTLLDEV